MHTAEWKDKWGNKIMSAIQALRLVKSGNHVFVGTGCAQPQHLVRTLVDQEMQPGKYSIIKLQLNMFLVLC